MRTGSFLLSLILHLVVGAAVLIWPGSPVVDLTREAYQVSLVMGDPGGENLPSPVLGARPPATQNPTPSAVPAQAPAVPATEAQALPAQTPQRDTTPPPRAESVPVPKPDPKPDAKPEPKPDPKPDPKPATPPKPRPDPLAEALAAAERQSGQSSRRPAGGGSSASRALAELAGQQDNASVGGGGGQGDGPGGGGIYDVYAGLVVLAVRPNWSMPTYSRENLVVQVRILLDTKGNIQSCTIERSSGRPDFDASAVNAVLRTGVLPEPPSPAQQDIIISFNAQELVGR